jgi:hypothetical protein
MSFNFAGVLTGKATNFVGGLLMPFLERRREVHAGLLRTVTRRSQCVAGTGGQADLCEKIQARYDLADVHWGFRSGTVRETRRRGAVRDLARGEPRSAGDSSSRPACRRGRG